MEELVSCFSRLSWQWFSSWPLGAEETNRSQHLQIQVHLNQSISILIRLLSLTLPPCPTKWRESPISNLTTLTRNKATTSSSMLSASRAITTLSTPRSCARLSPTAISLRSQRKKHPPKSPWRTRRTSAWRLILVHSLSWMSLILRPKRYCWPACIRVSFSWIISKRLDSEWKQPDSWASARELGTSC